MRLDELHPLNGKVLAYLSGDRTRERFSAEPILAPQQHPDPYMGAGSHPDCVERVWDVLGGALPAKSRALVYGSPALVHPAAGIVIALTFGTQYAIRIPADVHARAMKLGCKDTQKWSGGGETRIRELLGDDWLFGGWADEEKQWLARQYAELSRPQPAS
jgi:hypothetical protein